jgi:serine/threonine protein kinase
MATGQVGGRLLGQGAYGCVFMPPLLSVGQKKINPGERKITGKIMDIEAGQHETYIGDFLKNLPFAKNYFIFTTSEDISKPAKSQNDKDLSLCKKTQEEALTSLYMYKMPYGGQVLFEHIKNIDLNEFNFWKFGKNLLESIALMITHGVLHTDLHNSNIVVDEYYVPRIIDWGLSLIIQAARDSDIKSIVDTKKEYLLDKDNNIRRIQMPPEVLLFTAEKNDISRTDINNAIITDSNRRVLNRSINYFFDLSEDDLRQQLVDFQNTSVFFANAKNNGAVDWFKQQGQYKFDAWSIGVYLITLLSQLDRYHDILSDPKYNTHKSGMLKALRGLCAFNPKKRLNAVQALSIWDSPNNHIIKSFASGWL